MTTELLTDPHHTRRNLRQLESAVMRGFEIPDAIFDNTAKILGNILLKGKDREKIAAARVIVAIAEFNKNRNPQHVEHRHIHELGPVTEANIEEHRALRFARLAGVMSDT